MAFNSLQTDPANREPWAVQIKVCVNRLSFDSDFYIPYANLGECKTPSKLLKGRSGGDLLQSVNFDWHQKHRKQNKFYKQKSKAHQHPTLEHK